MLVSYKVLFCVIKCLKWLKMNFKTFGVHTSTTILMNIRTEPRYQLSDMFLSMYGPRCERPANSGNMHRCHVSSSAHVFGSLKLVHNAYIVFLSTDLVRYIHFVTEFKTHRIKADPKLIASDSHTLSVLNRTPPDLNLTYNINTSQSHKTLINS